MERIAEIEKQERARLAGEAGEQEIGFAPGDTVKVHSKIVEGDKTRVQIFQGTVIGIHKRGVATTFTVRKTSYGVGVEKIFPLHSPWVEKVEVAMKGRVRRAKLYYLRERRGKASRIKEKREA